MVYSTIKDWIFHPFLLCLLLVTHQLHAQSSNIGCLVGAVNDITNTKGFGANAFLYTGEGNSFSTGVLNPKKGTIDWFKPLGMGQNSFGYAYRNIIDQSDISSIVGVLSGSNNNPVFSRRQNGDISSQADIEAPNKYSFLVDAVWARDYFGGTGAVDSTSFAISSKNGQDPLLWGPGASKVLGKNDLIDVAGHMFREIDSSASPKVNNLWFVGLINRAEPGGDAYMDFEFFVRDIGYNRTTKKFVNTGPDKGHTSFKFDANGEISQLGDMLYNVSLSGGGTIPSIEVRIWVSYQDYINVVPTNFTWGPNFDGAASGATHGYASIIPKLSDSPPLCGYVNTAGQLPTVPPWGTKNTKSNIYIPEGGTYPEFSVTEVALNLTAIGIDNYISAGADKCNFPWRTYLVKTRSSASFSAALKDFAGPYTWGRPSSEIFGSKDTISCINPSVTLSASTLRDDVSYSWTTSDGQIVGSTTSRTIEVDKPGTYNLSIVLTNGCPAQSVPFVVYYDDTKPVISSVTAIPKVSCTGNDGSASISIIGGSAPFTYSWTGPETYSATTSSITGLAPGSYAATITDKWGCSKMSTTAVVSLPVTITTSATLIDVSCFGGKTGSINLEILNGTAPFTYQWTNLQKTQDLSNVAAGTYTVTVTDKDGCSSSFGYLIAQPASALALSLAKSNDTNPTAVGTGTITATATGGTPPYSYSWSGPNGYNASTASITDLVAGTYSLSVSDFNGCTQTEKVIIYEPEICDDTIDNDGDGLVDCEDPDCITSPVTLTPSDANPCVGDIIVYTAGGTSSQSYNWLVVPSNINADYNTGITSNTFSVTWNSTAPAQVCVRAVVSGCAGQLACVSINPTQKPPKPVNISKGN